MGLKYTVAKLEEVPEASRSLYKADGNGFVLDVDGVVNKERLDEFRNNNISLQQQLDKLKDIDPVKYRELQVLQQKIAEKKLVDAGDVDGLVNLRVTAMKDELEGKLSLSTTELTTTKSQLSILLIDNAVKNAAIKNGILPTAIDDIILRARGTYVVEGGQPVPKVDGKVVYGKDGTSPMTTDEWVIGLKKTAPHLFQGSTGSGAGGGRGGAGATDLSKMTPAQKISFGIAQGGLQTNLPGA